MTENLKRKQLEGLDELLRRTHREPRYRYTRGRHFGIVPGWLKIEAATGKLVASRCDYCGGGCSDYFPIPTSLASDE